jgi:hypothetical protein
MLLIHFWVLMKVKVGGVYLRAGTASKAGLALVGGARRRDTATQTTSSHVSWNDFGAKNVPEIVFIYRTHTPR